jgi:integrase
MRPSKEHAPYSLYKKQTKSGLFWYVRFWDAVAKEYNIVRSTGIQVEGKRERWREADDAAKTILEALRQETAKQNAIETVIFQVDETPFSVKPISPQLEIPVKSEQPSNEADTLFIQYLLDFWSIKSEYVKFKRDVKKKPLSAYYIQMNHDDVARHIATFSGFQGIKLWGVTRKLLKEWLIWMSAKKIVHRRKDGTESIGNPISGRRINSILQGMRVAVRWAVDNESLSSDPFRRLDEAAEESKEKGILTLTELKKLINLPVDDPYSRLAVLLAARCGMRRGEVRGLKWGDIKDGIITIRHNYINADGLKSPKIKGGTLVKNSCPVPLPSDVEAVLEIIRKFAERTEEDDFIMQSPTFRCKIVSAEYFRNALARELRSIGIDEETRKTRNLTFHSLRHTFVSLGRLSGISDFEIQTLARHKSAGMMERYSHGRQAIDFVAMKKRLEEGIGVCGNGMNTRNEPQLLHAAGGNQ